MIYFVERASDKAIKIGTTIRLSQRLRVLRSGNGECRVLAVTEGSYADEAVLHSRFDYCRLDGEWFAAGPNLLAFIANEAQEWDGVDEAPQMASVKIADDLLKAAKIVAAITDRKPEDVIADIIRPVLTDLYTREVAKAAAAAGAVDD